MCYYIVFNWLISSFQVPVSNYRNPILELAAFDQQGRKFDNFSSLSVLWESSKVSVASIEPSMPMELHQIKDGNKQMKLHGDSLIIVLNQTNQSMWRPAFAHFIQIQPGSVNADCCSPITLLQAISFAGFCLNYSFCRHLLQVTRRFLCITKLASLLSQLQLSATRFHI